jgi:hypothetical protein
MSATMAYPFGRLTRAWPPGKSWSDMRIPESCGLEALAVFRDGEIGQQLAMGADTAPALEDTLECLCARLV